MNLLQVYRRLWPYLKPYKVRFFIGFGLGLIYAGTGAAPVKLVPNFLEKGFTESSERQSFWSVVGYLVIIPGLFLVRGFCDYYNKYFIAGVGLRGVMDLRNQLFEHIHTLSLDFFNRNPVGDLISRIVNDAVFVQKAVSGATSDLIQEPLTFLGLLCVLMTVDWKFTLVALILVPLCLVPIAVYGRKAKKSTKGSQENLSELISLLNESFAGDRKSVV